MLNSCFYDFYQLTESNNNKELFNFLENNPVDIVILDLADQENFIICKKIRKDYPLISIILLTDSSDELNRIVGLEFGADSVIIKPVNLIELTVRIKALTWRLHLQNKTVHQTNEKSIYSDKWDLHINLENRNVRYCGKDINLAFSEFELLKHLITNSGIIQSRERLFSKIRGFAGQDSGRNIDSIIKRLRRKLDDPSTMIKSVRGIGYVIDKKNTR
jgi:DNA-binding response OmpR family regulator